MANDWRVAFRSTDGALEVVNTFCVHTAESDVDLQDATAAETAEAVEDWLKTKYLDVLVGSYTFQDITVRNLPGPTTVEAVRTIATTGTLAGGSGDLPQEVCMVLSLRSDLANRQGRGRMFIPSPLHSSHLDAPDEWSTGDAYYANVLAFGNALLAGHDFGIGPLGATPMHASARVWSKRGNASHDLTSIIVRRKPHWLRSRAS